MNKKIEVGPSPAQYFDLAEYSMWLHLSVAELQLRRMMLRDIDWTNPTSDNWFQDAPMHHKFFGTAVLSKYLEVVGHEATLSRNIHLSIDRHDELACYRDAPFADIESARLQYNKSEEIAGLDDHWRLTVTLSPAQFSMLQQSYSAKTISMLRMVVRVFAGDFEWVDQRASDGTSTHQIKARTPYIDAKGVLNNFVFDEAKTKLDIDEGWLDNSIEQDDSNKQDEGTPK
jgi:hypothetical protein